MSRVAGLGGHSGGYKRRMGAASLEVRASRFTEGLSSEVMSGGEVGKSGTGAGRNPEVSFGHASLR